jgi:hypothetical protein
MDIDLYVTREATSHVRRPQPNMATDAPVAVATLSGGAAAGTSSTEVAALPAAVADRDQSVAVALDCLAGAGVVAIGTFADAADARFAQDVLAALIGGGAPVQKSAFRWPQTQTGDPSRAAAEQAYAGFLNGQTERAGARLLLLLGAAATMLLPAERADGSYSVVECAAVADLRRDPAQKKALWLSIRRFASR